jgi:hypothetical protein
MKMPNFAHTGHPLRHWDRTCPACQQEPQPMTESQMTDTQMPLNFEDEWVKYEAKGYDYGHDALEQVRFGWQIAMDALAERALTNSAPQESATPTQSRDGVAGVAPAVAEPAAPVSYDEKLDVLAGRRDE